MYKIVGVHTMAFISKILFFCSKQNNYDPRLRNNNNKRPPKFNQIYFSFLTHNQLLRKNYLVIIKC